MFEIPAERLPPGFAERIEQPPAEPAEPRPAATAVLLRDGDAGPEVLLLRRRRDAGFVPGAYVFPGGRVDVADADPAVRDRIDGLPASGEPPPGFWVAAAREAFEETGVLLARDASGRPADARDPDVARWRDALLEHRSTLDDVLESLGLRLDLRGMAYFAHWITPVAEPRRYDTRFFLAALPRGAEAVPDAREMTDALWLSPAQALERFHAGRLPMVFPTARTLEALREYDSVSDALAASRRRRVDPILPRLVRTPDGVGIIID